MARVIDRSKPPQAPKERGSSKKEGDDKGEQMELLDVGPENLEKIAPIALEYDKVMRKRVELTQKEVELKEKIKAMVHESGLNPLADGSFRFNCKGLTISVVPRDEKVTVKKIKEAKDEAA